MLKEFIINLYNGISGVGIAPIIEFAVASFVVCVAYFAIHKVNRQGKAPLKFIMALLLGIVSYASAKVIIITWLIKPMILR